MMGVRVASCPTDPTERLTELVAPWEGLGIRPPNRSIDPASEIAEGIHRELDRRRPLWIVDIRGQITNVLGLQIDAVADESYSRDCADTAFP
jgi:hypothetical protein